MCIQILNAQWDKIIVFVLQFLHEILVDLLKNVADLLSNVFSKLHWFGNFWIAIFPINSKLKCKSNFNQHQTVTSNFSFLPYMLEWETNHRVDLRLPCNNRHLAAYKWFNNYSVGRYVATVVNWNGRFWGDSVCLKSRASDWHKLILSLRSWYAENWTIMINQINWCWLWIIPKTGPHQFLQREGLLC